MLERCFHLALLSSVLFACSDDEAAGFFPPQPGTDAGTNIPPDFVIREGFDSNVFVETSSGAIIDTNRGIATLPVREIPKTIDSVDLVLDGSSEFNGLVKGSRVHVPLGVTVHAPNSLDLRASRALLVEGRVQVGPGGLTLIAEESVEISGMIESDGPVRIRVGSRKGFVKISGKVTTLDREDGDTGRISVLARGTVEVTGEVATGDSASARSGDLEIYGLGNVVIDGLVSTGSARSGSGNVEIATESALRANQAAVIAGAAELGSGRAGKLILRGDSADFAAGSLHAGSSDRGQGGDLEIRVRELRSSSELRAGRGAVPGSAVVMTETASVSGMLVAGDGDEHGGSMELWVSRRLEIQGAIRGGNAECGVGGAVRVRVSGRIVATSSRAVEGGNGGDPCEGSRGGSVHIEAQVLDREDLAAGGAGEEMGNVEIDLDPTFTVPPIEYRAQTLGFLISRVFSRPFWNRGPRLTVLEADTPPGTLVKVQVADADQSSLTWVDATFEDPERLDALSAATRFRYRLWLRGLPLDAPVVDAIEIDLTP